jgi:hypothetical protein
MDQQAAENIAVVVGIVVAVSLALTQAMGGLVTYLVEAIKGTGKVKDGYSGIVAILIGMLLGMGLTGLADGMADEGYSLGTMLLLGAFAGALMAAGSVKTFKAMGDINTDGSYDQGFAHGERVAGQTLAFHSESVGPALATQGTVDFLAARLADLEAQVMPAEPYTTGDWQTTVDELGNTEVLTDAEVAAAAEARAAGEADAKAAATSTIDAGAVHTG